MGKDFQQLSEAIDAAGTVNAALEGLNPEDISPVVGLLEDIDVNSPAVDPDLIDPVHVPEEALYSSVEPSVEPTPEPREPTLEEATEKMFKDGLLVSCATEECDSVELATNAHRYQQTEDGEYICPQCQDEERTFH